MKLAITSDSKDDVLTLFDTDTETVLKIEQMNVVLIIPLIKREHHIDHLESLGMRIRSLLPIVQIC